MRNFPMMALAMPVFALLAAAPAMAATTIDATVTGFASPLGVTWTYSNGSDPSSSQSVFGGRINATSDGGSYPYPLLGGLAAGGFVAFCIEPLEFLPVNSEVTYSVVPLSRAGSGLGGIGTARADRIRELFGRFAPNGGHGAMTGLNSIAFQLAVWEIAMESQGNALNVLSGRFSVARTRDTSAAFLSAQNWLNQLDGTGPKAKGLVVLQNGRLGSQGSGSQDLLVFADVPEPSSWAMLIAGFGLVGAAMRRRGAVVA